LLPIVDTLECVEAIGVGFASYSRLMILGWLMVDWLDDGRPSGWQAGGAGRLGGWLNGFRGWVGFEPKSKCICLDLSNKRALRLTAQNSGRSSPKQMY
jgi:hypothetical protein